MLHMTLVMVAVLVLAPVTSSATAPPHPVLFGIRESAGRTFNAKTGAKGLLSPFQHTFAQGKNWTSPVFPWPTYSIPDQFELSPVDDTQVSTISTFSSHFADALHTYVSWHVFYGIVPLPVLSAAWIDAHELASIRGQIHLGAKLYGWSRYTSRLFSLNAKPAYDLALTAEFRQLLSALPTSATTAAEKRKFEHFFNQVGTHYVCRGTYGGRVSMTTFLDAAGAGAFSGAAAAKEMGLLFHLSFFHLTQSQFKNKNDIDLSAKFREMSKSQVFFTGGELTLQQESTQLFWLSSLHDKAALLEPTLCPISDFVQDAGLKAVLEAAADAYINAQ